MRQRCGNDAATMRRSPPLPPEHARRLAAVTQATLTIAASAELAWVVLFHPARRGDPGDADDR
jgi:hypothetical protein